jgi:ferric enterobactin receptor
MVCASITLISPSWKCSNGNFYTTCAVVFLFLFFFSDASAQQPISVSSANSPLSDILENVSENYGIRFAYDAAAFSDIKASVTLQNVQIEEFLQHLLIHFNVVSKQLDGTWLLLLQYPEIQIQHEEAKPEFIEFGGYVRDQKTGENLIYCNIVAEGNKGGMTNEIGYFNFLVPLTDSVRVLVSHLGYQRLDTVVSSGSQIVFHLKPSAIMMDPVKVVHYESQVLQASPRPEKIAFDPLKASAVPRIANDDMGNSLLLIPGVDFFQGGSSGLSIRGGEPTDNLVLFDGIPVLETSHLLGNMSVLNAKFVQQAFVSRGGFDATYGGRVSGLIELTGKSGKNNKPYLDLSANMLNTNVLANIPVTDKFSITAAWRRSFIDSWQNYLYFRLIDDVVASDENPVTSTIVPMVKFQDVNAKISFHPAENFELNLNLLYSNDFQKRDFELLQTKDFYRNESMHSKSTGFSFNLNWQANSGWYHSLTTGFSYLEKSGTDETGELQSITETIENPGKGQGLNKGVAKTREKTYTRETHDIDNGFNQVEEFRAAWKSQHKKGIFTSEAGMGWSANRYTYSFFASRLYDALQIDSISNNASLNQLNGFVRQNINVANRLWLRWGMRANFDPELSKIYWQPRGGIEFVPEKSLKLYFLSGVYYQFLSGIRRFDSEGHFSRIWFLPGEDGRGVVSGSHYILGCKYENKGWFIDLEAYHKHTGGKLNLFAENYQQGENQIISYNFRESYERNKGIDFFIQKKHFIFNHMAGYSLSAVEEQMDGFFGNKWFYGYNDRTHRLKLTEMVSWKRWTFTATWNLASGLPVYRYIPNQDDENFLRSGNFSQVNAALVKSFSSNYFSLSAGASLLNIFNRANIVEVNYLRFSSDTGSMTVRSDISALGTTPVFFMNIKF